MRDVPLGDVLEVVVDHRGKTPRKLGGEFTDSGVPVVSAVNIKTASVRLSVPPRCISDDLYRRWMPVPLQRGDVLLTSEAPLGEVAQVPSDEPMALGQRLFALRGKPGVLDNRYLFYLLQWRPVRDRLSARATGTTVTGIRQAELVRVTIPLPSYRSQRAIAEVLGAVDDKIQANRRTTSLLERRLAAVFEALRFDTSSDDARTLSELVEVNPPRARSADAVVPYIDMAAVPTDAALVAGFSTRAPTSGSRFMNGDTVMARITPCLENGKVAFIDCLQEGQTGIGSTEFLVLRPKSSLPPAFAYLLARSSRFRDYAIQHMSGTSGRQRCSADAIQRYRLDAPSPEALDVLATECNVAFPLMRALCDESKILSDLRDTLLPKLISGELRVRDVGYELEAVG